MEALKLNGFSITDSSVPFIWFKNESAIVPSTSAVANENQTKCVVAFPLADSKGNLETIVKPIIKMFPDYEFGVVTGNFIKGKYSPELGITFSVNSFCV
ncbi:MAG: hypothetical protein LPK01_07480, partial [Hymenobacteraceae bacterium]|nr:hypothetical protein [Hymenobacteraceae bacterium]